MELQGRIIQVMPISSGVSRNGNKWQRREFILETPGQYPKKVCLQLFGDRVNQYPVSVGQDVKVSFEIESREYQGRWYSSITAWKVEYSGNATDIPQTLPPPHYDATPADSDDEFPF